MKIPGCVLLTPFAFANEVVCARIEPIQYFTDRTAWEQALGGAAVVEGFDDIPARFQLQEGVNQIAKLKIEVERSSANMIVGGDWWNSVNGTNFWHLEAATQNAGRPPVTPALLFDKPILGFGADWYLFGHPNATMSIDGATIVLGDYGRYATFFGIVTSYGFDRVEFDVVNPFNTYLHADNVSFYEVPEPSSAAFLLLCLCGRSLWANVRRRK